MRKQAATCHEVLVEALCVGYRFPKLVSKSPVGQAANLVAV